MPTSSKLRVLGIDPGIERLGWAVVEKEGELISRCDSGVKRTLKTESGASRLAEIFDFISSILVKEKPERLAIEKIFFSKNTKTALAVSEVRGVILAVAQKNGLSIIELSPSEIKIAVCGYGRADKRQVADMLKISLKLSTQKLLDDETDALAIALTGVIHKTYFPK